MASDGQATVGSSAGPIRQPIQKIKPIGEKVLVGGSGSVGVIQRYFDALEEFSKELEQGFSLKLRESIRKKIFDIMSNEAQRHVAFHKPLKDANFPHASSPPFSDLIFTILENNNERKIWRIAPDGLDEFLEDIGYGCVGSGDVFAYTLLKNYDMRELDIDKGKLIAYRVVKEAIGVGAYGLGEPIDIWTISQDGPKQLSDEEIMALDDTCGVWIKMEQELFKKIYGQKGKNKDNIVPKKQTRRVSKS